MSANGHTVELREREARLVELYPWIRWLEPQPVTVREVTRLSCRFCTALSGLSGSDVLDGTAGFDSEAEYQAHLQEAHVT